MELKSDKPYVKSVTGHGW